MSNSLKLPDHHQFLGTWTWRKSTWGQRKETGQIILKVNFKIANELNENIKNSKRQIMCLHKVMSGQIYNLYTYHKEKCDPHGKPDQSPRRKTYSFIKGSRFQYFFTLPPSWLPSATTASWQFGWWLQLSLPVGASSNAATSLSFPKETGCLVAPPMLEGLIRN